MNSLETNLSKLNLDTAELDRITEKLTLEEEQFLSDEAIVILPMSPLTNQVLTQLASEVKILKTGTNWQAAYITNTVYEELDNIGQFPHFDYGETINDFL